MKRIKLLKDRISMKKKLLIGLSLIMALSATGCVQRVELEGEDEAKVIQYMVYAALEHDKNYLVNLEQGATTSQMEPDTDEQETTTAPTEDETDDNSGTNTGTDNEGTTVTTSTIGDALAIDGVAITYTGYSVCDSYPAEGDALAFVIKAVEGKNLVVLNFDMKNTTGSDIAVDIASMEVYFRGIFSNTTKTNAMVTLLTDALNTYKGTLKAGETVKTVLIFEMSEKATLDISSITVDVKSGDETKSVKIK